MYQQEVGLKNRITKRWMPPKPMCDSSNRANQFISVSITEIYPMLQIYGVGLCVSIIVLFLEIGFNTYLSHRGWTFFVIDKYSDFVVINYRFINNKLT